MTPLLLQNFCRYSFFSQLPPPLGLENQTQPRLGLHSDFVPPTLDPLASEQNLRLSVVWSICLSLFLFFSHSACSFSFVHCNPDLPDVTSKLHGFRTGLPVTESVVLQCHSPA